MTLPYQPHSFTSRQAANAFSGKAPKARHRVFLALTASTGMTDEELCAALNMGANTERPRRVELERAGLIRDSGRQRPTRSGVTAVVWVAVPGATYEESLFRSPSQEECSLVGDAKALDEIQRVIPERKRSPELTALLQRLDYEINDTSDKNDISLENGLFG